MYIKFAFGTIKISVKWIKKENIPGHAILRDVGSGLSGALAVHPICSLIAWPSPLTPLSKFVACRIESVA